MNERSRPGEHKSPWRAQMLRDAGLYISTQAADIDERAVDAPLREAKLPPEDISS